MSSCQRVLCLTLLLAVLALNVVSAVSVLNPAPRQRHSKAMKLDADTATEEPAKFVVITEDVIPDVENTTQKVIRVNPLDLPSISDDATGSSDSSLYKIQALLPANRNYVNSSRMRRPRPRPLEREAQLRRIGVEDSPIIRHLPEPKPQKPRHQQPKQQKKQLHFLYNQEALDGSVVSKTMLVHVAPGAYPVYYGVSKTNGRFGKFPIKGFRDRAEFKKYLLKTKVQPIERTLRFDS